MAFINREKEKKYKHRWYIENRERLLKKNDKYYKNNRDKVLKICKIWYENNKKYRKKYRRKYYLNNIKKELEQGKKWREDNTEKWSKYIKKYFAKYSKTERGKARSQRSNIKRRTIIKNLINTLTSNEWLNILEEYNYKCAYCGCKFDLFNRPTRDHIIPISKGGHNTKENIVPACQYCNSKKNNKLNYSALGV